MKLVKQRTLKNTQSEQAWEIYEEAFPRDERRSRGDQERIMANGHYSFSSIQNEGEVIGVVGMWAFDGFNFIEHFAIKNELRGKGIGSDVISELLEGLTILEAEPPTEGEQARKRILFWKRMGFFENDFDYMQPPYSKNKQPVPLVIMTSPRRIKEKEFIEIRDILYQEVYNVVT